MYDDLDFLLRGQQNQGGWNPQSARVPQSTLGIEERPYQPNQMAARLPQSVHGATGMDLPMPDDLQTAQPDPYAGMLGGGGGWRPQAARVPQSTLGIGDQPYTPPQNQGGWRPRGARLPQSIHGTNIYETPNYDFSGGDADQAPYAGLLGSQTALTISPEANGERAYDPFNNGLQQSPFKVTDNYMENGPVHTLGYSSRHGISAPTVDYSGVMQRAGIDRYNMNMADLLGRQDMARSNANLDLQKMMLMSEDRNNSIMEKKQRDYNLGMQKLMPGSRGDMIDRYERDKVLTPQEAQQDRTKDIFSGALEHAKKDANGNPTDIGNFLGVIGSRYDQNKHVSKSELMDRLMMHGVTAEKMIKELIKNPDNVGLRTLMETLSRR